MQGDLDIVDPLIDDYLTRLAGSPDPVEAEMRRYADERDGFPIVGPVVGQLLSQLAESSLLGAFARDHGQLIFEDAGVEFFHRDPSRFVGARIRHQRHGS